MFGSYCFVWLCNLLIFLFWHEKRKLPLLEQVEITGVAAEGKASPDERFGSIRPFCSTGRYSGFAIDT